MGTYRTDQVLKAPLLGTEVKCVLSGSTIPHHQRLISLINQSYTLLESKYYYKIFSCFCSQSTPFSPRYSCATLTKLWRCVAETWKADQVFSDLVERNLPNLLLDMRVIQTLEKHVAIQKLIQKVSFSEKETSTEALGNLVLKFDRSLVLCIDHAKKINCLMTYNHFLAFADVIRSRFHLLVGSIASDLLKKYPVSLTDYLRTYLDSIDSLVPKLDHDTYFNTVKSIYPFVQAQVLCCHNRSIIDDTFPVVTEKINHALPNELLQAIKHLSKNYPVACLELFSVSKSFFFPEISLAEGAEQQFRRMRQENTESPKLLPSGQKIRDMFVKEYIKGYLKKHNKWPNVELSQKVNPLIANAHERNDLPADSIPYYHYRDVKLLNQGISLTFEPDLSDIITDKAIIETKNHWTYEFNAMQYHQKHKERLQRITDGPGIKRLIIALLDGRLDDIRKQLEPFIQGEVSSDDLVTILVPKEKELKVKGRFFSKQSCRMRLYQVLSELNIKKSIMPYLSSHSMTTGSTQLSHILDRIAQLISTKNGFVINLDYESWCNTFRPELQLPICEEFDSMFSSGCFFQTGCLTPTATCFIIQDRFNSPKQSAHGLPEEDFSTCINGALSPGEGMRQKLWTIMTGCIELIALEELGIKGEILGQGDNQTLIIQCPLGQEKTKCKNEVLQRLHVVSGDCGLVLKPEECWSSDVLYEYGKRMYFKGTSVPNFFKIFSRVSDSTGEVYPNIYSRLSCLSSSCLSGAQADTSPWASVMAALAVYVIEQAILLPKDITSDVDLCTAIGLVGPTLGGLPSPATLPSVFYRGLSDPLTFQLKLLASARLNSVPDKLIKQVCKLQFLSVPSPMALCVDPCCLNIAQIRRPERILREWIEESLSDQTQSSRIMDLVKMEPVAKAEALASTLINMEPKFSRLMSYIFTKSNAAYGISILDKFQKSSTIIAMSQSLNMRSIVEESRLFHTQVVNSLTWETRCGADILEYIPKEGECSFDSAARLRKDSWGFEVAGATMPFIPEQFALRCEATADDVRRSIIFTVGKDVSNTDLTMRGTEQLFLGSRTFVKVSRGTVTGMPEGKLGKMAEELVAVYDWLKLKDVSKDDGLVEVMDVLLHEKNVVVPDHPVVSGGTMTHRLPSSADDRAGLAGSMNNMSTHSRFTTDYMLDFARSGKDYTLHFQGAFLHGHNVLASRCLGGRLSAGRYYLTLDCTRCTREITEETFTIQSKNLYPGIPLEMLPVQLETKEYTMCGDSVVISAHLLGLEIYESLSLESRGMASLLDSGQSPMMLERLSLSHVAALPPRVVIHAVWYASRVNRQRVSRVKTHLRAACYMPVMSPTLRWVSRWASTLKDQLSLSGLVGRFLDESLLLVPGANVTAMRIGLLMLAGVGSCTDAVGRELRLYKTIQTHCNSLSSPPLDTLLGSAKRDASPEAFSLREVMSATTYHEGECHMHSTPSSMHTGYSTLLSHLKAYICLEKPVYVVLSEDTPIAMVLDLCHVAKVVWDKTSNTEEIDEVSGMDSCGAVARNLLVDFSLSTISSSLYYYKHSTSSRAIPALKTIKIVDNTDLKPLSPCASTSSVMLTVNDTPCDLSKTGCLWAQDVCPSLTPQIDGIYKSCVNAVKSLVSTLYTTGGTYVVPREGSAKRLDNQTVSTVKLTHRFLEIVRNASGYPCRPKCRYYLRPVGEGKRGVYLSLRPGKLFVDCDDFVTPLGEVFWCKGVDVSSISFLF
ncbi:TPA_asm: L polymerase [electric eel bornavirus]|uniref:RNA-directed RNA polymerase n=1 Tax=electric eel bornavirus TaxID=3055757 RepID=A0AA48SFL8_9MONO|nr:TPA_asm: L polymerase [electric eel bornavirus]